MTRENTARRLAERIGRLEEKVRQVKKLIVQKYGKPWWKVCSENLDFEQFYTDMVNEPHDDFGRGVTGSRHGTTVLHHSKRSKESDRPGQGKHRQSGV